MASTEKYRYNSVDVARFIVAIANEKHISINITKVQKLLYIAYGIYLAVKDERLTDEQPQAWPYGPVFPNTRAKLLNEDFYSITWEREELFELRTDSTLRSLFELVFNHFGQWTASQLTAWSHGDGSPWERTTEQNNFKWGNKIPDAYIQPYFNSIIVRRG